MMHTYAIRNDGYKYQELDLEILDVVKHAPDDADWDEVTKFSKHNTALKSWWVTPDTKFINYEDEPLSPIPDISCWIDATLVLSPKAYRMLGELLKPSGEFLPVSVSDETYYIFNCFVEGEADKDKSRFNFVEDMQMGLEHLEFKPSVSDLLIFKTGLESCLTLFCGERFKEAVECFELTGIAFDKELIPEDEYADG